jgi:S1-C subfamily serine protease
VVVSLDGKKVESSSALSRNVALRPPGATVTLGVVRGGKSQDVKVTLTSRPGELDKAGDARGPRPGGKSQKDESNRQRIGSRSRPSTPAPRRRTVCPPRARSSPRFSRARRPTRPSSRRAWSVTEAGGKKIGSADDLSRLLKDAKPGSTILLRVQIRLQNREESTLLRALTIPGA